MTRLNLMAGGPDAQLPDNWQTEPGDWAGIDRGTLRLLNAGIVPEYSVGDYDSLTDAEYHRVELLIPEHVRYAPEKDYTDTQLALKRALARPDVTKIYLYGATGGRIDHELANLYLPMTPELTAAVSKLVIIDATNRIEYLHNEQRIFKPNYGFEYFGVVTLSAVTNLSIAHAKYPLQDWSSTLPFSWASNEFLRNVNGGIGKKPITVSVESGYVAVVYSRDYRGQKQFN